MTSRERFRIALSHQEPDRVPIDVGSDLHNGIHEKAYVNLLNFLGENDTITLYDQMQHLAKVKETVLQRLHTDTRYIYANPCSQFHFEIKEDSSWYDEWGVRRASAGLYDENIEAPLAGCTLDDVKKYKIPDGKHPSRFEGLREQAKSLYESTDYALVGANAASLFFLTSEIVGYQEYMEKIMLEPEIIETLVDKILEYQFDFFNGYLDAIGDYIEMIWMGDDWGTQLAPLMNPQLFRQIFVKRYAQFVKFVKSKADVKVALHTCGAVHWALEDLAKAGIDVVHPLQGDATGLADPYQIKREFGDSLVFYSNLKNQTVIPYGSTKEVAQDVMCKIDALAPGGGYIMSGGHNFQADVPPENIITLIDTTLKYGTYPIRIPQL